MAEKKELDRKYAVIVAGGNGAGKSTLIENVIIPKFNSLNIDINFINADVWQLKHFGHFDNTNPTHAREAQKWAEAERQLHLDEGRSFIAETVFSHPSKVDLIKEAKSKGFYVVLYHISLDNSNIALDRIKDRVLKGGHDVDEDKVKARYERVLPLVAEATQYADMAFVLDNSVRGRPHHQVFKLEYGKITAIDNEVPDWAVKAYEKQLTDYLGLNKEVAMSNTKEKLGFEYNPRLLANDIQPQPRETVVNNYRKNLVDHVANSASVAGNSFKRDDVESLLKDVTVGGHSLKDQRQVLNLIDASNELINSVRNGNFALNKSTYLKINGIVSDRESIEAGVLRGEGVETAFTPSVGIRHHITHRPIKTEEDAPALNKFMKEGFDHINSLRNPLEKGVATFLFGSLNQFTFEGEKRTAHLMMNGVLMSAGLDAITIPAEKAIEFRQKMVRFYETKNADEVMEFVADNHPALKNTKNLEAEKEKKSENDFGHSFQ